jgi:hypothetical protein
MVRLLFHDAEFSIVVNRELSNPFQVQRGVHHGCLLAPYLVLIIAKSLNVVARAAMQDGVFRGIQLPNNFDC